jgi:hypothetical protein
MRGTWKCHQAAALALPAGGHAVRLRPGITLRAAIAGRGGPAGLTGQRIVEVPYDACANDGRQTTRWR